MQQRDTHYSLPGSLVITALLLVVILITVSAYLRLSSSGLGCTTWPDCYGTIGQPSSTLQGSPPRQYTDRLLRDLSEASTWATPVHRVTASILAILIAVITFQAFLHRNQGAPLRITASLLLLTLFLAILGVSSAGLHLPAIILGNLAGGFTMLALLWALYQRPVRHDAQPQPTTTAGNWILAGILLLIAQIMLGALTSANFAILACTSLPDCHGQWWPGDSLWQSFKIFTPLATDDSGRVIMNTGQQALHILHRLGAIASLLALGGIAVATMRTHHQARGVATLVLILLLLQTVIGIASVRLEFPIGLAVTHNGIAALLLLGLLSLYYKTRPAP